MYLDLIHAMNACVWEQICQDKMKAAEMEELKSEDSNSPNKHWSLLSNYNFMFDILILSWL